MTPQELVAFAGRLRAAGLVVEHPRLAAAIHAMPLTSLYWALRLTLCGRRSDLPIFDRVFRGWQAEAAGPVTAETAAVVVRQDTAGTAAGEKPGEGDAAAAYTADLGSRDLRSLTGDERALAARLIAELLPATRLRPAARWKPARHGRIDRARTVRLMIHHGGEPTRLQHRRRGRHPRRLLFLIDISRSMQTYVEALLLLAYAAVTAARRTTEVFLIGTRCTRVTADLRAVDVQAIQADWLQGTQLGRSLETFLRRWSGHRLVRSAVVVIASDGLEDDSDRHRLPRQVARLSRIADRIIWVNPAARRPGYRPAHPGLRESLRHVHEQYSGHTLDDLRRLVEAIAR